MGCAECDNLLFHYESLTFASAKIENALEIARRMGDAVAVRRLAAEALGAGTRQRDARAALDRHRTSEHQRMEASLGR